MLELVVAGLRWLVAALVSGTRRLGVWTLAAVRGPVARFARGPVATLLFGRRAAISVVLVGFAPALAALTAWVVGVAGYALGVLLRRGARTVRADPPMPISRRSNDD